MASYGRKTEWILYYMSLLSNYLYIGMLLDFPQKLYKVLFINCLFATKVYTQFTLLNTLIMFYQTTILLPIARMNALIYLLEKVESQAQTKHMSDTDILSLRLAPDMYPLSKQIQIVSDNAK